MNSINLKVESSSDSMVLSSWKICCASIQQRWIFAVMGCLAITNAYTMRICLSLAITEMVAKTEASSNSTKSDDTCPTTAGSTPLISSKGGTYEWDEYTQGIILSSFFWGYIVTQLPGGILADKFGGKHTLGVGIFSTAIFTLITPLVVQLYDSTGLIVLRVLMGFGEGTTLPALSVLIAQWAPPLERSKIGVMVMSGISVGTVLGNAISGVLIRYSPIGWPIVFYFYGACGVLWFLAWIILCYSHPDVHPFISEKEKNYLHETTKEHTHREAQPIPWRHMLTSVPLWALIFGKAGYCWGFLTMVTDLPKYMSNILKFSIEANGFLSALPHILTSIIGIGSSWLADWSIKNDKMSRTNIRKSYLTIALIAPAILIISASYAGCDQTLVVVLFTLGVGMMGPSYPSILVNPNDLSPNYSGTLMAIVNTAGALTGILAPLVVGVLTPNQTLSEWRIVFWITFVIFCSSAIIFSIGADGEVQYWNDLDLNTDHQKDVELRKQARQDPPRHKNNCSKNSH